MSSVVFDIETEPLPDEELREFYTESELPPPPGEFDPESVALGNVKDPAKIEKKIAEARQKHEEKAARYEEDCEARQEESWYAFVDKAALSPVTGRVLTVGVMYPSGQYAVIEPGVGGEYDVIAVTFRELEKALTMGGLVVGFNSNKFDLPFLIRRAWKHSIMVPEELLPRPFFSQKIVDLMERWQCGDRSARGKLDEVARFLGVEGKFDGMTGAEFHKFYRSGKEGREQALEYLRCDLRATLEVANQMQVL